MTKSWQQHKHTCFHIWASCLRQAVAGAQANSLARLRVLLETDGEVLLQQQARQALPQRLPGAAIVAEPQVATDDVLEQAHAGLIGEHGHHAVQYSADCKEALGCGTDVVQAYLHTGV